MKKGLALIFSFIILITTGCTGNSNEAANAETNVGTNTIRVAGSTTVTPLMRYLRLAYEEETPNARVEVQEIGTSAGIVATIEGVSHIAMSSRHLSEDEINQGLVSKAFALDGIAVIVHPENPVNNLTSEEVTKIFKGEITNWSQVGGADAEIVVVSREEGSGIRSSFEDLANLEIYIERNDRVFTDSGISRHAIFEKGTGAVTGTVRANRYAIGYVTAGVLDGTIKPVDIDGVAFSEENVRNGSYVLANTFFIATKEEMPVYAQEFVDFIFSDEGQAVVTEKGYISIR